MVRKFASSDICQIANVDTLKASKMLKAWEEQGMLIRLSERAKCNMAYLTQVDKMRIRHNESNEE